MSKVRTHSENIKKYRETHHIGPEQIRLEKNAKTKARGLERKERNKARDKAIQEEFQKRNGGFSRKQGLKNIVVEKV